MPRPRLPIGDWGRITVTGDRQPYTARALYRDTDGHVRRIVRRGQTKKAAEAALVAALRDRKHAGREGVITANSTLAELADAYLAAGEWSDGTRRTYGVIVTSAVKPAIGSVRLAELRPSVVTAALQRIADRNGPGAAKSARAVLSGMCHLAVAHDALDHNPVRDAAPIRRPTHRPRKTVRALAPDETDDLCDRLRASQRATDLDLPDLVEWMLGTGCRIGEACAARGSVLDLGAGTWEINATVIRLPGRGLVVQERPKTAAGWRVLALPSFAVQMAQRRAGELRFAPASIRVLRDGELREKRSPGVVFPAAAARNLRDPSNTAGDLREVLDMLGWDWVTSHVFRKTVATRLDEAGMSARQIADQLGHAKPSMTQDVYMGRRVVSTEAARLLDR